jgi:hypothetical protein
MSTIVGSNSSHLSHLSQLNLNDNDHSSDMNSKYKTSELKTQTSRFSKKHDLALCVECNEYGQSNDDFDARMFESVEIETSGIVTIFRSDSCYMITNLYYSILPMYTLPPNSYSEEYMPYIKLVQQQRVKVKRCLENQSNTTPKELDCSLRILHMQYHSTLLSLLSTHP